MSLWADFISLIYPRSCVCCDKLLLKSEEFICNYCFINLPKSRFETEDNTELDKVFYGRVPAKKAGSYLLFEKSGKVQKLLHSIKYQKNRKLAIQLGMWYGETLRENPFFKNLDLIVPVPLHKKKMLERGFNQSEEFAKGLGKTLNIPVSSSNLIRTDYTVTQTRKNKIERWENVKDKFELLNPEELAGKSVLIVDDVITTGATMDACYQALQNVNDLQLVIVSLAYAKKD